MDGDELALCVRESELGYVCDGCVYLCMCEREGKLGYASMCVRVCVGASQGRRRFRDCLRWQPITELVH